MPPDIRLWFTFNLSETTVDSEIFARILFSWIALKDKFSDVKNKRLRQACLQFRIVVFPDHTHLLLLTYINERQSDFAISRGFYFHESFAKIKSSRKFSNLQYIILVMSCMFVFIYIWLFICFGVLMYHLIWSKGHMVGWSWVKYVILLK